MIDVSTMNIQAKTLIQIEKWEQKYGSLPVNIELQMENLILKYKKEDKNNIANPLNTARTTLIREYQGKTYSVTVSDKGFSYNGEQYRSLSAIANKITGSHCNGKRFFKIQ